MNKYRNFVKICEDKVNSFPMMFAFSKEQFKEGLAKLGVGESEVMSIGSGGYIRKKDKVDYNNLLKSFDEDLNKYVKSDDEFVLQMFEYEMANHEYCITYDDDEVISCCGLKLKEFYEDERLKSLYIKAKESYLKNCN